MKRPWYREPFVWLLILFPASAVIAGMITISLAINSNDGLVVDDYYKQGLEINRTLERDKAAARHALQASLNVEQQLIHLNLNAHPDYNLPNQITLRFSHRTRSGFDKEVLLERIGDNRYQGTLPELIVGAFYVQLAADDWRLLKSVRLPMTQELQMRAEE
ncbi:MAG TPA: hypothetical protein ENF37_10385 [Beggiatoa sp.]|nr:MAG: hypothetical protein B6247_05280 [Beggiatoa sp. 4572_84]RKZ64419.1 MAG: hypothetical protein DRR08_00555 [Gammaproteobacteria bacterium]HEW99025.1 hypothetical protein [Beggiatoa sp.]